ncbi:MAG: hypothetical protein IJU25_08595, partial [Lachnospiraceae bacterium]|nr:hypothetical protein [Lachnospiraceae bacterium]
KEKEKQIPPGHGTRTGKAGGKAPQISSKKAPKTGAFSLAVSSLFIGKHGIHIIMQIVDIG